MSEPSRLQRWAREWRGFALFVVIMLIFRSAIADWNHVPSGSMIPSILKGDRIIVDKLAYDLRLPFTFVRLASWSDPRRSDVITFDSPEDGTLLVKRVIGIPGDVVQMRDNRLSVNGVTASYEAVPVESLPSAIESLGSIQVARETLYDEDRTVMVYRNRSAMVKSSFGPVTVPDDHYLMLGDNRDNSQDFRFIGFVHRSLILGKANTIAFSLDFENYYAPRSDRFFKELK